MTAGNNPTQQPSSDSASKQQGKTSISESVRFKRRDKRKSASTTVGDPFELVGLAVRYDEARLDESLLQIPLEEGRLYDSNQFGKALDFLQKQTRPPARLTGETPEEPSSDEFDSVDPPFALTPIILSGLLTSLPGDVASQLVSSCQTWRRQALARVRLRKRRIKVQRIILPLATILVLLGLYLRSVSNMKHLLTDLKYVKSCEGLYQHSCRLQEAVLWDRFRNVLPQMFKLCPKGAPYCQGGDFLLLDQAGPSPLAMHTRLERQKIDLQDIMNDGPFIKKKKKITSPVALPSNEQNPYMWLADSTVNLLVREALAKYLTKHSKYTVLDIGCGVGGSLYALMDMMGDYVGISHSAAEIHHARLLQDYYLPNEDEIVFEKKFFDTGTLPKNHFTVLLAIESLSHSRDLKSTLESLLLSLKKGGILVIVDFVAVVPQDGIRLSVELRHASLLPYVAWRDILPQVGCEIKLARDLSLEYDLPEYASKNSAQSDRNRGSLPWHWGILGSGNSAARRMIMLHEDRADLAVAEEKFRDEYSRVNLAYHMYVCEKMS